MVKWIIEKVEDKYFGLPTKSVKPQHLRHLSPTAWKILQEIAREPTYPKALSKKLKMHEQKIYYHIRNLKKAGLIKIVKQENIGGIIANYYSIDKPSFTILLRKPEPLRDLKFIDEKYEKFFYPFIKNGEIDALLVIGSSEPHGIHKAKAEDATHGMALALLLGSFLNKLDHYCVKWDTEIRGEDLKQNLILIGGPAINKIVRDINKKLPIRFAKRNNFYYALYSSISKKYYTSERTGMIVKIRNPFCKEKSILVIAGRRYEGTRAAIISLIKDLGRIVIGNKLNPAISAKVVEGFDLDGDGQVDTVEIRE